MRGYAISACVPCVRVEGSGQHLKQFKRKFGGKMVSIKKKVGTVEHRRRCICGIFLTFMFNYHSF